MRAKRTGGRHHTAFRRPRRRSLPRAVAGEGAAHLFLRADHVFRPDPLIELLLGQKPEGERRLLQRRAFRSEEHTSELQSLMRISYAVFCLKKKTIIMMTLKQTHT